MSIFEIIFVICLIIFLFLFCLIYTSNAFTFINTVKSIIQKRKHKKLVKKLKDISDKNCINLLEVKCYGYTSRWDPVKQTFILEKEEEKDGN